MTARPPLEQIDNYRKQVLEGGHDHPDRGGALWLLDTLRAACEHAQNYAAMCQDDACRAAILDPRFGVPTYLADAAGDVAQFFTTWDDRRADRAQDARDNKAADAADARIAL